MPLAAWPYRRTRRAPRTGSPNGWGSGSHLLTPCAASNTASNAAIVSLGTLPADAHRTADLRPRVPRLAPRDLVRTGRVAHLCPATSPFLGGAHGPGGRSAFAASGVHAQVVSPVRDSSRALPAAAISSNAWDWSPHAQSGWTARATVETTGSSDGTRRDGTEPPPWEVRRRVRVRLLHGPSRWGGRIGAYGEVCIPRAR